LKRARPGGVFTSSACDAWQPIERDRRLTRECCRLLTEHGFAVHALTKSALIVRDFDVLRPGLSRVGVTVTTLEPRLARLWEPHASPVDERWAVLEAAREAGLETSVMFGPLLPFLSDGQESLNDLMARAADAGVGAIWVDAMNARPRVWPAVARLLRREFPDLHDEYGRILHHGPTRDRYVAALRMRVRKAAERAGVADRVGGCP